MKIRMPLRRSGCGFASAIGVVPPSYFLTDIKVMEDNWGWSGWNPPDSGNAIQEMQGTPFGVFNGLNSLGGGNPNNDGRYVSGDINATPGQMRGVGGESVIDFL
jgi:choline-sulfatase